MPRRPAKISSLPLSDRPREKLQAKGPAALSDFELLEVIVGAGSGKTDVGQIARRLQRVVQREGAALSRESLMAVHGVHVATASKILAALELARRHLVRDALPLNSLYDILARLDDIRARQQEYLLCLNLDGGQRLIAQRTITIGTLSSVLVHPREVFADAIADRAASVIVAHNHPSGDVEPSQRDIDCTQQLAAAGQLLGIPLRDHIIVTKTDYFSYRQHHLL